MAKTECRHCKSPVPSRKGLCIECEQIVEREKGRATGIVKRAVAAGDMLPASSCKCACCDKQAIGYGHFDYGQPLNVFPVCRSCNRIRKQPAQIGAAVVQYIAPIKREKEKPSGVIARTKIRKAWCEPCGKNVAVNGRICLECGHLCAKKITELNYREKHSQLVKSHMAAKVNQRLRDDIYRKKIEDSRQKFEGSKTTAKRQPVEDER